MAQQEKGIKLRAWTLHRDEYQDTDQFRLAVANEMAQLEHMGERLGVGFVIAPVRRPADQGGFETVAWFFQTETIPAAPSWQPDPVALDDEHVGTLPVMVGAE